MAAITFTPFMKSVGLIFLVMKFVATFIYIKNSYSNLIYCVNEVFFKLSFQTETISLKRHDTFFLPHRARSEQHLHFFMTFSSA